MITKNMIVMTAIFIGVISAPLYATEMEPLVPVQMHPDQNPGEVFLLANSKKPGVVTLADGLQYKILKEGTGQSPTDTDTVVVNYVGKLIDGTEFDSSYKRGEPSTFRVGDVIPGWTEALKLMKPGSSWMLYIPSSLAYGDQGAPPVIGSNQTLIFQVDLIEVKK